LKDYILAVRTWLSNLGWSLQLQRYEKLRGKNKDNAWSIKKLFTDMRYVSNLAEPFISKIFKANAVISFKEYRFISMYAPSSSLFSFLESESLKNSFQPFTISFSYF